MRVLEDYGPPTIHPTRREFPDVPSFEESPLHLEYDGMRDTRMVDANMQTVPDVVE